MSEAAEQGPTSGAGADIVGRHRRLGGRTALISAFTLLSRVLGYGRELLSALLFGDTSVVYDAFVTAWRVPNLFRRLLGEGAVSTALQTTLTETDGDRGEEAGRRLVWDTLRLATGLSLGVCALVMAGVALMGDTMPFTGWHWMGEDPAAVRELLLRVMPYVIVICLAGLIGGALAVRGRFAAASAGPGLINVVAIATLVFLGTHYGWSGPTPEEGALGRERHLDMARVFTWGLLLAGTLQLGLLLPAMRRCGLLGRGPRRPESQAPRAVAPRRAGDSGAWTVLRSSLPLAVGAAVYQINVMIDGFMAQGLLTRGGPTTYYFANRIQQLPLALVATAATAAVFPALKAYGHRREWGQLRRLHDRTHRMVAFVALPATAGLAALSSGIVSVLLGHGEFGPEGVARTAQALTVLSFALVPAGAAGLVVRTYYALDDFRTPVVVSCWMLALNVVLNTLFLVVLDLDVAGLALSTLMVSLCNLVILLPGLRRRLLERERAQGGPASEPGATAPGTPPAAPGSTPGPTPGSTPDSTTGAAGLVKMALAAAACGGAARAAWIGLGGRLPAVWALGASIACGATVYVSIAALSGWPEWRDLRARLRR